MRPAALPEEGRPRGEAPALTRQLVTEENPRCRKCGSLDVGTAGGPVLRFVRRDLVQRYRCHMCGSSFTAGTWLGHKFPEEIIEEALEMARSGFSMRMVAGAVSSWTGLPITGAGVALWVRKFKVDTPPAQSTEDPAYVRAVRSPVTGKVGGLRANGGHAFLLGLFYSSGGIYNDLHFAVDLPVAEYLQQHISSLVGEVPKIRDPKGYATYSAVYSPGMLGTLRRLGLRTARSVRLGRGKWVPSRSITMGVPPWVRREPFLLHRFVEGYINGLKSSAGLRGRLDKSKGRPLLVVWTNVKISFCSYDKRELLAFVAVFVRHFRALGVYPGFLVQIRRDGRRMLHYSYGFHSLGPLRAFQSRFLMVRPMIKVKLALRLNGDPVLRYILQRTRGMDNFVLGMLLERPMSLPQLVDACPRRPYNHSTAHVLAPSLRKLEGMGVITREGVTSRRGVITKEVITWKYDPSVFATRLARSYAERYARTMKKREEVQATGRPFNLRHLWDPKAKKIADTLSSAPLVRPGALET